jgi:DNA relaxase NicK
MAIDGAIRHMVLFKVGKKEDIPYVVEEIKKFEEDTKHHVSILSYFVSSHTSMIDHFFMQTFKINSNIEILKFSFYFPNKSSKSCFFSS